MLTRRFILLFYLGAKRRAEQIENGTAIFHQRAYKRPRIVPQTASLATDLASALEMDHPDIFPLAHRNILLEPLLTAQSNTNSNQSAATSTDSAAEQVSPDSEHL